MVLQENQTEIELSNEANQRDNVMKLLRLLQEQHPDARCQLECDNPLQLMVAAILTAQSTERKVNQITPLLFSRYETAAEFAAASRQDLEKLIRPTGFYRQKARYIQGACEILLEEHGGEVPRHMDALLKLPGISRKIANIILAEAFEQEEGIVVDTHVMRVAQRLGLTEQRHPKQIELDLMENFPRQHWSDVAYLLSFHGNRVCYNRRPNCTRCPLNEMCPTSQG